MFDCFFRAWQSPQNNMFLFKKIPTISEYLPHKQSTRDLVRAMTARNVHRFPSHRPALVNHPQSVPLPYNRPYQPLARQIPGSTSQPFIYPTRSFHPQRPPQYHQGKNIVVSHEQFKAALRV